MPSSIKLTYKPPGVAEVEITEDLWQFMMPGDQNLNPAQYKQILRRRKFRATARTPPGEPQPTGD